MAWKVDSKQSKIEFLVTHLRLTTVRGRFTQFEGTLHMDEENPTSSDVEGTVDVASVKTGIGLRDSSLRAAGFFDVKRFPKMSFRSTRVGPFDGNRFQVHGDLTIRDITRPVVFDVVDKGEMSAVGGQRRHAFDAALVLNRKDFDLKWNPLMEFGGLLVADKINAVLEIVLLEE
jgi:polyisoprenoid-binding protein YceI